MTARQIEHSRIITPIGVVFNSVISLMVAVIGFFLIHTLDSIDKKFDVLTKKIDEQQYELVVSKQRTDDKFAEIYRTCCKGS